MLKRIFVRYVFDDSKCHKFQLLSEQGWIDAHGDVSMVAWDKGALPDVPSAVPIHAGMGSMGARSSVMRNVLA